MDTFFDRTQIVVAAVLLGCVELGVLLIKALAH
jgi:hypothetical protein